MEKRWITGIDVGVINVGLSSVDEQKVLMPRVELSTFLKTKDGRVYKKYEEGISEELVGYWFKDRWNSIISKSKLVVIEKQMVTDERESFLHDDEKARRNRACLVLESVLKTFLKAYMAFGGPPYLVISPSNWRAMTGMEVGNNTIGPIPPKFTGGKYQPGLRNPCYKEHKEKSRIYFQKLASDGDVEVKHIQTKYGKMPPTDVIEAYFISRAARMNVDKLIRDAVTNMNHDADLTSKGVCKRLFKEQRMAKEVPFWEVQSLWTEDKNKDEEEGNPQKKKKVRNEPDDNEVINIEE